LRGKVDGERVKASSKSGDPPGRLSHKGFGKAREFYCKADPLGQRKAPLCKKKRNI